jgi:hypothetical protein
MPGCDVSHVSFATHVAGKHTGPVSLMPPLTATAVFRARNTLHPAEAASYHRRNRHFAPRSYLPTSPVLTACLQRAIYWK